MVRSIGGEPHVRVKLFNARFRDELPDGEIFHSLGEAHILTERWRVHCNTVRAAQCLGLSATGAGKHRSDGPEACDALTIEPDRSKRARHGRWIKSAART